MKKATETTAKTEVAELQFSNLNPLGDNLDYIEAMSTRELLAQIKKIRLPVRIVSIYSYGSVHIAWIETKAKIKKIKGE